MSKRVQRNSHFQIQDVSAGRLGASVGTEQSFLVQHFDEKVPGISVPSRVSVLPRNIQLAAEELHKLCGPPYPTRPVVKRQLRLLPSRRTARLDSYKNMSSKLRA